MAAIGIGAAKGAGSGILSSALVGTVKLQAQARAQNQAAVNQYKQRLKIRDRKKKFSTSTLPSLVYTTVTRE